jgi:hypothetical protein
MRNLGIVACTYGIEDNDGFEEIAAIPLLHPRVSRGSILSGRLRIAS